MQKAVLKIQKLGVPPEGFENDFSPEDEGFPCDQTLDLWEEYQDAVISITQPITWEEAEILIKCCPIDRMSGIEWSLLHCIESVTENITVSEKDYRNLIEKCNSDMMKNLLLERFENYVNHKK